MNLLRTAPGDLIRVFVGVTLGKIALRKQKAWSKRKREERCSKARVEIYRGSLENFASYLDECDAKSAREFCGKLFVEQPDSISNAREKARMCINRRRKDFGRKKPFHVIWVCVTPQYDAYRTAEEVAIDKKYEL